ncbi:ribosome small subunit-dependent GTPase A [Patescibacteria group bacterium]|nr:ribosome small subunit-dependent GTPase A [Patescibacteria group bacterium]
MHVIIVGVETVKVVGRVARVSVLTRMRGDRTRKESGALETHVIAANVHVGVIVCSAKQPDFHPHFIDRFLVALQVGGIAPIICINKSDLGSVLVDVQHLYAGLDFPIVEISVRTGYGIEKLKTLLHAKSTVFLGQSGVGKSSLVQTFVPRTMIEVGLVSAKRGTGKHTTTASSLYQWEKDSFVIDTPGIRSLGVEDIPKNQLRFFFPEFADVADSCKFRDCIHLEEPHCGVKKAVEEGLVRKARYESYCRLLEG